ncbi:hypothetical protein D3C72_2290570 [compost metagenome]
MRLYLVAPLAGLLGRPAQQAVIGQCRQAQHRTHNVVAVGLNATGHQAIVARQVTAAAGERIQLGQQVGIRAARKRLPVTQGQVGV